MRIQADGVMDLEYEPGFTVEHLAHELVAALRSRMPHIEVSAIGLDNMDVTAFGDEAPQHLTAGLHVRWKAVWI